MKQPVPCTGNNVFHVHETLSCLWHCPLAGFSLRHDILQLLALNSCISSLSLNALAIWKLRTDVKPVCFRWQLS